MTVLASTPMPGRRVSASPACESACTSPAARCGSRRPTREPPCGPGFRLARPTTQGSQAPIRWRRSATRTSPRAGRDQQLAVELAAICLDGSPGYMQLGRDLCARVTEHEEAQDLVLPCAGAA